MNSCKLKPKSLPSVVLLPLVRPKVFQEQLVRAGGLGTTTSPAKKLKTANTQVNDGNNQVNATTRATRATVETTRSMQQNQGNQVKDGNNQGNVGNNQGKDGHDMEM